MKSDFFKGVMSSQSPSSRRMKDFYSKIVGPALGLKSDPIREAQSFRFAQMDIAFQQKFKRLQKLLPLYAMLRMQGGSGFRMANILRHFFLDYLERLTLIGPYSLPSSFNVVEAFLKLDKEFLVFDILQEKEHVLQLTDYFDWYTSEHQIPEDPEILVDILDEGIIYSFDIVGDTGEYTISTEGSKLAIMGASFVRHENELSVILLSGENPPYPPDLHIPSISEIGKRALGHEEVSPDETLTIKDRYIEGMQGFSKVIMLSIFNLESKKHDIRYIHLDCGNSYSIFTDDIEAITSSLEKQNYQELIQTSLSGLERYKELFSALASLIYLPVMFIAEPERIVKTKFSTELVASGQKHDIRKATKEFGRKAIPMHRIVNCLSSNNTNNIKAGKRVIDPPDFTFESTGYWKSLDCREIGKDKKGNPIVGKTWVERVESYSAENVESFIIEATPDIICGDDPGIIYIMRSGANVTDIYKVGLTRRSAQKRAAELSATTGVPLPFEVLASWNVTDCALIEKKIHNKLKSYRVNKRREFFRISLSSLVKIVEDTITNTA